MKLIMIAVVSVLSLTALADMHKMNKGEWEKMTFEEQKQMKLDRLTTHSNMIEKNRQCINSAKDKEALRKCGHEMDEEKRVMKERSRKTEKQSQEARP